MSHTFVKLPPGDIEIDHIREMHEDLKDTSFAYQMWKPRPALIERNRNNTWLYTGQRFDPKYIDLVEDGWTDDHCQVCFVTISDHENEHTITSGYFDGYDWVCKSCYEIVIDVNNLEERLAELQQYDK